METCFDGENAWLDSNASNTITAHYLFGDAIDLFGDAIDENLARYRPANGPSYLGEAFTDCAPVLGKLGDYRAEQDNPAGEPKGHTQTIMSRFFSLVISMN